MMMMWTSVGLEKLLEGIQKVQTPWFEEECSRLF